MDKKKTVVEGQINTKIRIECFNPFSLDCQNLQPIRLSFGIVNPKGGMKPGEYAMKMFPHGVALIINNEQFARQSDRHGTAVDERNLTHTFRFLGYRVEVHRNLDGNAMLAIMNEVGRRDHAQYDSFVCCILSHGKEGHIYGADGTMVSLGDFCKKVDANNCPSLGDKPKLFFMQACRGRMREVIAVHVSADAGDESPPEPTSVATDAGVRVATDSDMVIPTSVDFFFGYATPLGSVAWRDIDYGSWYVAELCKALCELSTHASLGDIMTRVCLEVGRSYECLGYKVSPEMINHLSKNVYF